MAAASKDDQSTTKSVKLPELGEGVTEGELIKWLVKPGDSIKPDQTVAEVMTDKATVEVPSPIAGVVKELKFKSGDIIKVESIMLTLEGSATSASITPPTPTPAAHIAKPVATPVSSVVATAPVAKAFFPPVADSKVLATPSTRRLARELNLDINELKGSGLAGRVTRDDVQMASAAGGGLETYTNGNSKPLMPTFRAPAGLTPGPAEERIALKGIRKKIAENMQMSKHIIPHFTLMDEAEVTDLVALRESLKEYGEKAGLKITYLPFVMKALISTCREFPMFNASIDDQAQEIVYKKQFHMGFAADTPNGLMVPVIKNADLKTISQLSAEIMDLSKRARDGKLKPDEMKGATITITNIGSVGGTYATPIINHPEVAILGMYKIQDKIILGENNEIHSIKVMNFTITADHRLIDGAVAANFLKAFIGKIQNPGRLMLDMI